MGRCELFQEEALKQEREHAHVQEEARPARDPALAVERDAASRDDDMDVRMMGHGRAPAVEPDEISMLFGRYDPELRQLIIRAGLAPMILQKAFYDQHDAFKK